MNLSICSNTNGLVAYYPFNQGIAGGTNTGETTADDVTPNDNNGTLHNFALTGTTSNWIAGVPSVIAEDCSVVCAVPTNLSATNITTTSAKLNWDAAAGAEGYKVHYKVAGTSVWTKKMTTGNSKNISGLSPNTTYSWEAQTFCQTTPPHVKSDWSSMQEFTTAKFRVGDESVQQVSFQIYPNPAQDHATIQFSVGVLTDTLAPHSGPYGQSSHVYIQVYDVSGREIETLLDDAVEQGDHSVLLNSNQFSKGVYFVKMISDFGIVHRTPYGEN